MKIYLQARGSYDTLLSLSIWAEQNDIKRIGLPDDISSLTKFLASDKANYITGQTFHVNGGMLM